MIVRLNGKVVTGSLSADARFAPCGRSGDSGLRERTATGSPPGPAAQNAGSRLAVFNSSRSRDRSSPAPTSSRSDCTTESLGLGPAQGSDCFAPTKVSWFYRANDNTFKPLASPTDRPADLVSDHHPQRRDRRLRGAPRAGSHQPRRLQLRHSRGRRPDGQRLERALLLQLRRRLLDRPPAGSGCFRRPQPRSALARLRRSGLEPQRLQHHLQ